MSVQSRKLIRFGLFELDVRAGELRKQGTRIKLQPQPLQVLNLLLEHPGELVTREELRQAIWPAETFVDFDLGVDSAVYKLRQALCDSVENSRFVETLPRRGYRFIAPVSEVAATPASRVTLGAPRPEDTSAGTLPQAAAPVATPVLNDAHQRGVWLGAALIVSLAALLAAAPWRRPRATVATAAPAMALLPLQSGQPPGPVSSIAILPFRPLNQNLRDEYLELGIADTLITRLSRTGQIVIRPTSAVRKFTDVAQDPIAAGRELKVESVLDGSLQKLGTRIRVNVRLVRVSDGRSLWASQFDEQFSDIFAVEDSISEKIENVLALQLSGDELKHLARHNTQNVRAYDEYLKGRYHFDQRTHEGLRESIPYFRSAIQLDPKYATAHAALALSYSLLARRGGLDPRLANSVARQAAEKAVQIDGELAEAHEAQALVKSDFDWDWSEADVAYKRSIQLNPADPEVHHQYSHFLTAMGRTKDSLTQSKEALELIPLDLVMNAHLGWHYVMARQYDQAVQQCKKSLDMGDNYWGHYYLGQAYEQKRLFDNAIREFQAARRLSQDSTEATAALGYAYAVSGRKDEARTLLAELDNLAKRRYVSLGYKAFIYAGLGDNEHAMQWLESAYRERPGWIVYLNVDPRFDRLRSDPRFQQLVRRVGLSQR
jgi:TolB-like protein/DNA-binding winged helix-turn-helix (wHTH) protein/Flp pilus assembly protein TadD